MNICWVGFHEVGLYPFKKLVEDGIKISAFFTLKDEEYIKRSAGTRQYLEICKNNAIPIHYIRHINDDDTFDLMKSYDPDVVIVMGWSQIVNDRLLNSAKIGVVGGHSSLLPHNKGSAPVNWTIIKGENRTGITLMWLNAGVDDGKIISQIPFPIEFYDTCESVYGKVSIFLYIQLRELFGSLKAGVMPGKAQTPTEEELLPHRKPSDGLIDWSKSAEELYNFVRALTKPYPCAFSYLDGHQLKIVRAALPEGLASLELPGTVIGTVKGTEPEVCGISVACGSGVLILTELEAENGEVLKGYNLVEGGFKGKLLKTIRTSAERATQL
ncbi:MAG: methionyl-tRNA formyltransferase [Eubacteriaceae bacterium]|nr:methionyl-tRNA formyltransferase [Eubacteriaceae bacterium]